MHKILICDDDKFIRQTLQAVIESVGEEYEVKTVGDPITALKREFIEEKFDLLITDYDMPGMNGLELVREVFKTNKTLPVICISGWFSPDARKDLENQPNVKILLDKPFGNRVLLKAVSDALDDG